MSQICINSKQLAGITFHLTVIVQFSSLLWPLNKRSKELFITLSIVYSQILNTYLPEFVNILLYVEANPVLPCEQSLLRSS